MRKLIKRKIVLWMRGLRFKREGGLNHPNTTYQGLSLNHYKVRTYFHLFALSMKYEPGPIFALVSLFNMNKINDNGRQKNNFCLGYCKFASFCQNIKKRKICKTHNASNMFRYLASHQRRFITKRVFENFENYNIIKNKKIWL